MVCRSMRISILVSDLNTRIDKAKKQGALEGQRFVFNRFKFALQEAESLQQINKFCLREEKRIKELEEGSVKK